MNKINKIINFGPIIPLFFLILIFFIIVLIPFFTLPITSYDGTEHLIHADFIKNYTWPNPIVWNPFFFFGYQQNQFYPPLFYFLVATLGFFISIELAGKIIVVLGYSVFFLSIHSFSKRYFNSKAKSILSTIAIFCFLSLEDWAFQNTSFYGLNFSSTFNGGLFPTVISGAFLFLFLYSLEELKYNKKMKYLSGIFLGLSILSHFIGLIGIIFGIAYIVSAILKKEKICQYIYSLLIGFGISAWWFLPFIINLKFAERLQIPPEYNLFFIIFVSSSIICGIYLFIKKKRLETTIISLILLLILVVGPLIIEAQLFRLVNIFYIIVILQIIGLIKKENLNKIIWIISFLSILFLLNQTFEINFNGEYSLEKNNEVGIVAVNAYTYPLHHQISYVENYKIKNFIANGLFVESSMSSPYVFMALKSIDPGNIYWGVKIQRPKIGLENFLKQANILGISYIITDLNLNIEKNKKVAEQTILEKNNKYFGATVEYYLYDLNTNKTIEALPYTTIPFYGNLEEWKKINKEWFIRPTENIFVLNGKVFEKKQAIVSDINYSSNYQSFSFTIDSNEPVAVYIRQSYYPTWHAYQGDKEIPIYLASPNFMIIEGQGKIEFKQEPDIAEYLGWVLTGITIIILIIGLKPSKNPHL